MSRNIIKDYNFKLKVRTYLDKRRLVDDSTYKPYETLVKQMLESGEVRINELQARTNMLFNAPQTSDKPLSITNVKGIDKFDVDNHLTFIRNKVVDTHKKASEEFNSKLSKDTEEYYKNKYSSNEDKSKPAE